jgi:hypothetical protein
MDRGVPDTPRELCLLQWYDCTWYTERTVAVTLGVLHLLGRVVAAVKLGGPYLAR